MAVHFESSRSERGSDRERLGMDGMMIYSILRDARTLSTVEILLFLSYSVALFKTSDTKPKVYSANCFRICSVFTVFRTVSTGQCC